MFGRQTKLDKLGDTLTSSLRQEYVGLSEKEQFTLADYRAEQADTASYRGYSYWGSTIRIFLKDRVALIFLSIVVVMLLFTFIQPILPGQKDPSTVYNDEFGMQIRNHAPDGEYWFGTNAIGQDIWSRTWSGTRTSLLIGAAVALINCVVGIIFGVIWGYVRKLDALFTELYNAFDNVPQTLVLIIIAYSFRPSVQTLIIGLTLTGWLGTSRYVRNQVLIIRDRDYNLASRCLGTPLWRIMLKNLLPYLISIITLRFALAIPAAISEEVFITYIGLGLPTNTPSLGNLINDSIPQLMEPALRYQLLFPTAILALITISLYVAGNKFADASDPKNHTV
jgi:oligopeptide transport system permease protein